MKKIINFLSIGILLFCLAASFDAYAQPANDDCAAAMDISSLFGGACNVSNLSMVIDNTGATGSTTDPPEPGESPTCPQTDDTNLFGDASTTMETSVWFTFTVPDLNGDGSDVSYSLWTSDGSYGDCGLNPNNILGGDADTQVAIYESTTCPDNTLAECDYFAANEDLFTSPPWISGWLDLQFTPGQTYYMLIDTWDGAMGEFCLSVTPCGTICGDAACAPVETYCDCVDCQTECTFGNIAAIEFVEDDPNTPEDESGNFFSDDLQGNIFFCSEFVTATSNDNIYLGFGATNWTDCAGTLSANSGINLSLSVGQFLAGATDNGDGTVNIATGALFYIELTPADIAAGTITITASTPDGIGNFCEETITINFADFPQSSAPYCELTCFAGSIDPNLLDQTVCIGGTIDLVTDGNEDLTLDCPPGFTYQYVWRILGDPYSSGDIAAISEFPYVDWVVAGPDATLNVDDFFIDVEGNSPPDFTPGLPLIPADYYIIQGAALCIDANGNIDSGCFATSVMNITLLAEGDAACSVAGCTDPCDPNYDATATVNDPALCAGYDDTCNADCTLGSFGGTWDAATCACINETTPVSGCTDATACNFDAAANCDNGSCDSGIVACADPCNPVSGCTNAAACNYDVAACVDDNSCDLGNPACADPCNEVAGCTDSAACNYDPTACVDDGTCDLPDGCTDAAACNYDPAALCDNGSCDLGNTACADPCNEPNPDDNCDLTTDSFDAATCTVTNAPNCSGGTTFNAATCMCDTDVIMGCTDACADNFDATANMDDGSCTPYDDTCNADCTVGSFGGTWDAATCGCINETTPVDGCTDATANNYDPAANCDNGGCVFTMCDDPCAPNFGAAEACEAYDMTCNADCTVGSFGGVWDAATCGCINETAPVNGCTDATATNYDAAANCDDGSCITDPGCTASAAAISGGPFSFCVGDGTPDFVSGITVSGGAGANSAWVITDDQLNILGLPGMPGEVDFDGAGFGNCLIWYVTFDDIMGAEAGANAADLSGCFALSNSIEVVREDCTCLDEISGTITTELGCDVSSMAVLITDSAGNPIGMAMTDANGDYALANGPFPCGEYIATLDVASLTDCYADAGGDVGPSGFTVNGDGQADGANFSSFDEVPTLSQWGLMTLALLLMTFGALKMSFVNNFDPKRKRA